MAHARYDNHGSQMVLTSLAYQMVQLEPAGLAALIDRVVSLALLAKDKAKAELGNVYLIVDVTRQPNAYRMFMDIIADAIYLMITTHGRLLSSTPYWLVGRHTLLSHFTTLTARNIVRVVTAPTDDPRFWQPTAIREAMAKSQAKPPKPEADEYVLDTLTEDDVTLALAVGAMYAELSIPDPWFTIDREEYAQRQQYPVGPPPLERPRR
jgi:hypothetical protein